MRLLILVNPNASGGEEAMPRLKERFDSEPDAELVAVETPDEMLNALDERGPEADRIVLGGGDGTISSMLPKLLKLKKPLGVLPLGTANDFARTLSLPEDPIEAVEVAIGPRTHLIDVGMVNDHPFINVASVGVASKVSELQSKDLKRSFRVLSYAMSFREAIRDAKPFSVSMTLDDHNHWRGMVHQVSVGNGRFHGGGLVVAEDAAIDDGKLHIYVVRPGTFLDLAASVASLKFGLGGERETLKRRAAETVRLTTSRPRHINIDGDIRSTTPAEFSVARRALEVAIPSELPPHQRGLVDVDESRASEESEV
ncbi:Diacylglycerol kinase [Methyloligella halotolerans]|uniref:Diacylglycerol kinase n=1 Tax=Methyloligella halotolerans TaxID=1177755 RepID=A0A1E2S2Q0_9HYPH|nr:YegS/Rv2252/BmrU family lipid kinase [Methyloligella halotolerans]ODA68767.1 Diacylglycerol kinase [Methyloligella halotolerans]